MKRFCLLTTLALASPAIVDFAHATMIRALSFVVAFVLADVIRNYPVRQPLLWIR